MCIEQNISEEKNKNEDTMNTNAKYNMNKNIKETTPYTKKRILNKFRNDEVDRGNPICKK